MCTDGLLDLAEYENTLIMIDGENIDASSNRRGCRFAWKHFLQLVRSITRVEGAHYFSTINSSEIDALRSAVREAGYTPHLTDSNLLHPGGQRTTNSDSRLLLETARRLLEERPSSILLMTGDGELGASIAEFVSSLDPAPFLIVAAVPGSCAQRLDASMNPLITSNVWIGTDLLDPMLS